MVSNEGVRALARTARILSVLERAPDHPRAAEYKRSLKIEAGEWAKVPPDAREETIAAAEKAVVDDNKLSRELVAAAIAALEG